MKILLVVLIFLVVACSGNKPNCQKSKSFLALIHQLEESDSMLKKQSRHFDIHVFPEKVNDDPDACGSGYSSSNGNFSIVLEEYSFSEKYIKDRALKTTLGEFFVENTDEYDYYDVSNIPPSSCFIIKIKGVINGESLDDFGNGLVKSYLELRK